MGIGIVLAGSVIPMICSSEKQLRFMLWSPCLARANFKLD